MKKSIFHGLIILIMIFISCKKEKTITDPPPSFNKISGIWIVDSVVTTETTDIITSKLVSVDKPHTLDFSLVNSVIESKYQHKDTASFHQLDEARAISDLHSGNMDTLMISTVDPDSKIELEWKTSDTVNQYNSSVRMYLRRKV